MFNKIALFCIYITLYRVGKNILVKEQNLRSSAQSYNHIELGGGGKLVNEFYLFRRIKFSDG